MIAALVPVKRLAASKSRLLPRLAREQHEALSLAMLRDVLDALAGAERVQRIAVVTPDDEVARTAREAGAEPVRFREPGLNAALDAGAAALALGPEDGLLVVLGDVAGALAADIDALCASLDDCRGKAAALAPSSDGGTAALLRRPPDALPSRFGADSAKHHREAAEAAGAIYRELPLASLVVDLDTAEDVRRFLATPGGGRRTRALLGELDWDAGA
jgi:2-phospho-L-lactate guanylyltransferase